MLPSDEVDEPMAQNIPSDNEAEQQIHSADTGRIVSEPLLEVVLHGRNGQYVRGGGQALMRVGCARRFYCF